jgi:hypothetical protein
MVRGRGSPIQTYTLQGANTTWWLISRNLYCFKQMQELQETIELKIK